jgi:Protein of unknown function (DUF4199)
MFKSPFQIAIIFTVIALVIKVSVFSMEIQHGEMERYIWYIYMLLVLLTVFFGIRSNKINNEGKPTTFGQDFKAGARTASFFAILVSVITYFYYAKIDVDFFEIKRNELLADLPDKIAFQIKEGQFSLEEIKTFTKREIINSDKLFTPYFQSMWTMFGLVFIGLFQTIIFSFLMKKFPGFKQ